MANLRVIDVNSLPDKHFPGGATYRTLIGDGPDGARPESDPVRIGIQTSPPGYATPLHSHPYDEILTTLEGEGIAWTKDGGEITLKPGVTLLLPANKPHAFRVTGKLPLVTYGLHLSGERLVDIHDDSPSEAGHPETMQPSAGERSF